MVAVPSPLFVNVSPAGMVPGGTDRVAAGVPMVVTRNGVAAVPTVKVAVLALVMVGDGVVGVPITEMSSKAKPFVGIGALSKCWNLMRVSGPRIRPAPPAM